MKFNSTSLSYGHTGSFSHLIVDYLNGSPLLQSFYAHPVSLEGIKAAIRNRQQAPVNRVLLTSELTRQYSQVPASEPVQRNINALLQENTFTVCTAHQPAIFTGHLYFIYKILHTIKLCTQLQEEMPGYHFVPVFWMGSEDADLEELGHIYLGGEKISWQTQQTGAVGRMSTRGLDQLVHRIAGELSVQPHGNELVQLLQTVYLESPDIQTATFRLLHSLFAEYGLIVLLPDNTNLKRIMQPVFEADLFKQQPAAIVQETIQRLSENYKVQANPRQVNLFYLKDDTRELIEVHNEQYEVRNTAIHFTKNEIAAELQEHPGRFSPNVILRGLYQEMVLPNIAFIGGGGETAYWLELKDLFDHYRVPFPVLVLRNSFLIVEKKWQQKISRLGFRPEDFFRTDQQLLAAVATRHKNGELKLHHELDAAEQLYLLLKNKAEAIDKSLAQHVEALRAKTLKPIRELEKKLVRAEKKKYDTEQRHIQLIKSALFPGGGLQERVENFMPYYAAWGKDFITSLYQHSGTLEQQFVILEEQ